MPKIEQMILNRLDRIEEKVDAIVPELAVVKERSSTAAKIISAIGGLIAVAISAAIAFFR